MNVWVTPSGREIRTTDKHMAALRLSPDDFHIINRIPINSGNIPAQLSDDTGEQTMVFLDTETTGVNPREDHMIQLGMVRCKYNAESRRIVSVDAVFDEFDDPHRPIPEAVTNLTGITEQMVSGCHVDEDKVREWLGPDPLIVAHNAAFDRPIFEKRFTELTDYRWACSFKDIEWRDVGYSGKRLAVLLLQEGWFYNEHRALDDCFAIVWLLHMVPDAFDMLLESQYSLFMVVGRGRSYHVKDDLKKKFYKWNDLNKTWSRVIPAGEREEEEQFLHGLGLEGTYEIHTVDPRTKFKMY